MAHSCPYCDSLCHCGGDIDDIQFDDTPEQDNCMHCAFDDEEFEEDEGWQDDDCSYEEMEDNRLAFEAEMKNWPQPPAGEQSDNEANNLPF